MPHAENVQPVVPESPDLFSHLTCDDVHDVTAPERFPATVNRRQYQAGLLGLIHQLDGLETGVAVAARFDGFAKVLKHDLTAASRCFAIPQQCLEFLGQIIFQDDFGQAMVIGLYVKFVVVLWGHPVSSFG